MNNTNGKFNFFMPIDFEKGSNAQGGLVKIKGVASTESKDSDGETLIPEGFDVEPLMKNGFLNWNHQARTSSKAICGEPTKAEIINNELHLEGVIYPNEEGKSVVELAETLQKYSPNRRLGFSIEGQAVERGCGPEFLDEHKTMRNPGYDPILWKRVTKARITGVAITQSPKNPNTLMSIVKGEYNDLYQDEKEDTDPEVEKAMMVNLEMNPPSIEGTEEEKKLKNTIKKSEIYNQIRTRYTDSFEKANQIYNFIQTVKSNYMKVDNITPEILEKAFNLLDESILMKSEDSSEEKKTEEDYDKKDELINKGDDPKEEKKDDAAAGDGDGDEDEEFEKAINAESFAKSLFEKGMNEDEVVKAMTCCGVNLQLAETASANCIAQANEAKQGGDITVLQKAEENQLGSVDELIKGLGDNLDKKFSALGTILKASEAKYDALQKSHNSALTALELLKSEPQGRRSVVGVKAIERFEKSQDSNIQSYNPQNIGDMRALNERLFGEIELIKANGGNDPILEKAVADLEISKSADWRALSPRLRAMGIDIQG